MCFFPVLLFHGPLLLTCILSLMPGKLQCTCRTVYQWSAPLVILSAKVCISPKLLKDNLADFKKPRADFLELKEEFRGCTREGSEDKTAHILMNQSGKSC